MQLLRLATLATLICLGESAAIPQSAELGDEVSASSLEADASPSDSLIDSGGRDEKDGQKVLKGTYYVGMAKDGDYKGAKMQGLVLLDGKIRNEKDVYNGIAMGEFKRIQQDEYKGTQTKFLMGGAVQNEKDEKTGRTVGDRSDVESDERDDSTSSSGDDEAAKQPEEGEINVKAGKIVDATKDGTGGDYFAYCSILCVGCDPPPTCVCGDSSPLPGLGC